MNGIAHKNTEANFFSDRCVFFLLLMINSLLTLLGIIVSYVISIIIDMALKNAPNINHILLLFVFFLFLIILFFPLRYFYRLTLLSFKREKKYHLVNLLRKNILFCSHEEFIRNNEGVYISRFSTDITNITDLITISIEILPGIILSLFFSLIVTIYLLPYFLFFYILAIVPFFILYFASKKQLAPLYHSFVLYRDKFNDYISEMLNLVVYSKIHAQELIEYKRGTCILHRQRKMEHRYDNVDAKLSSVSWLFISLWNLLAFLGIIFFKIFYTPQLTAGNIFLLQGCSNAILGVFLSLSSCAPKIVNGIISYKELNKIIGNNIVEYSYKKRYTGKIFGKIEFSHVSFGYPENETPVLNDCSFTISPHMLTCLVGPSGTGKSTALKLLTGLLYPMNGRILIDNIPLNDWDITFLRENISVVTQNINFFSGSIRENITYGNAYIKKKFEEVINLAGLSTLLSRLPQGADSFIDECYQNISGGEKQRIAIARAFYRNPKILILDESITSIDPLSLQHIMSGLHEWKSRITIILITHRLDLTKNADWLLFLDRGTIVESGTPQELLNNGKKYASLLSVKSF